MRKLGLLFLLMVTAGWQQALAQSGVVSGPPQVRPNPGPAPAVPDTGPGIEQRPSFSQESWVAVVAGFRDGRYVRVGFARRSTRADAEIAAIEACNGGPGNVRCGNPYSSSRACLYIVPGKKRGGVTWGRGATREVALRECRRGGYSCRQQDVLGGCPDSPS